MSDKHRLPWVLLGIMALISGIACTRSHDRGADNNEATMRSLFQQARTASLKRDFRTSDSVGAILLHLAEISDNDEYRIRGLLSMSYSRMRLHNLDDRLLYLRRAERILGRISNDTIAAELYNFMGVCAFLDFELAKEYFAKSLYAARKIGSEPYQMIAECNLAEIYRCTGDTLGIQYDLDIHDFAVRTRNETMRHAAAVRCAEYYMKHQETMPRSLEYINEIRDMPGREFHYHYLKSKWLIAADSLDEAMDEWNKATDTDCPTPGFLLVGGRLHQHHGDYSRSESILMMADDAFSQTDSLNPERIEILRLRSKNLERLGHTAEALEMLERYQGARDSIQRKKTSRELNAFKVKFETEKKELLIASQREALRWRNILLCISITFIIVLTAGFMLYIRRRNRLYRLIAEQQKEFATRQNEYAPYLSNETYVEKNEKAAAESDADLPQPTENENRDSDSGQITDKADGNLTGMPATEKADAIWRDILTEMEKNRIYADPDVTRDVFADRVHTNHTWFTAIIKHRTGKSYSQFMNSWRVNEAVRILSLPEATMTNKELSEYLGFMTPQSFYTAFRQQMGMSPSRFRSDTLSAATDNRSEMA